MEEILRKNSKKAVKLSINNSPNLDELQEVILDNKTKIYFRKDATLEHIALRTSAHKQKLCAISVAMEPKEELVIKGGRKTEII